MDDARAGVAACDALLARHLDAARAVFGAAALGVLDLPPMSSSSLVPAQIELGAVLYWARELEAAGLLPFVEGLAQAVVQGRFDLRGDTRPLLLFTSRNRRRHGPVERQELFSRMFGGPGSTMPNAQFDASFRALVEALAAIGRAGRAESTAPHEARARALAADVGSSVSSRAVGMAGFAAREIVTQVATALRVMSDVRVVGAMGPGSGWDRIRRHAPQILGRPVDPDRHVTRADAGRHILTWVSQEAGRLQSGTAPLGRAHPILRHAERFLAVSDAQSPGAIA